MICVKCGNENKEGIRICVVCGSPATQKGLAEDNNRTPGSRELDIFGVIKFDASENEEAAVIISGMLLEVGLIFKCMSALFLVSLLIPFYRIADVIYGVREPRSINGLRVAFGGEYGSFAGVLLFLIPFIIFLLFQFKQLIYKYFAVIKDKLFFVAAGLTAIGVAALFAARSSLAGVYISVRPWVGFVFSFILYVIGLAVSVCFIIAERKK